MLPADVAVNNGIEWLDANAPGWRDKVNPQTLEIDSVSNCVLGQVYGPYYGYTDAPLSLDQKQAMGFTFSDANGDFAWAARVDELNREWRRRLGISNAPS